MARPRPTLRPSGHEYSANRHGRGGYGSRLSTLGTSRIDATHGITDDSSRASPSAQPTLKTQYVIGRTLRVRPGSFRCPGQPSQHESDGREQHICTGFPVEAFPVLGEATAPVKPRESSFDHPSFG